MGIRRLENNWIGVKGLLVFHGTVRASVIVVFFFLVTPGSKVGNKGLQIGAIHRAALHGAEKPLA